MTTSSLHSLDIRLLRYFSVVAEENNMSRAAQRLFMSQPPLSRHIRQLEERLGVTLFVRHTRGLTLTEDGLRVLEIVRPLLALQDKTWAALGQLAKTGEQSLRLGLSTAFEQGVFTALESRLNMRVQKLHIVRHGSPELVRQVRRGKLDAALVALPLETPGLTVMQLGWQEPMIAALPAIWPEASLPSLSLTTLNHRPLFWFKRERNPAFFDYTRHIFRRAGYSPACIEEPLEHDVLLARIAQGDGLSLIPASFSAIQRQGVIFLPLTDTELRISMGLLMLPENVTKLAWLQTVVTQSLIISG
ncbi:LysR family transcriptional regulator [Citrobacter sp. BNK-39]|uniref:LysR family transcriptional regulator n=1 Tax=Citrobacter portucalensis TaxID=1639133 RepID=A0ABD5H8B2_9ENTR|nr:MULTISPECIES: LysR family transcriptional regulator [Citrobacter]EGS5523685.1 LysR family transcriptional regulator [Citrobacter freundii]NCB87345.1 LysR family transcriptional regulator [Gammaproteobacteria bacterium]MBJ8710304.1 LysR family transcriptional regulator [Citrobacter freundii]MCY3419649.1 LysR family transcriptional regulator [Citrobacter freundii]MDE9610563.1 LysR family transcriptional regulator [Citrobacter portucalensis]